MNPFSGITNLVKKGYGKLKNSTIGRRIRNSSVARVYRKGKNATKRGFIYVGRAIRDGYRKIKRKLTGEQKYRYFVDRVRDGIEKGDNRTLGMLNKLGINVTYDESGAAHTNIRNDTPTITEILVNEGMINNSTSTVSPILTTTTPQSIITTPASDGISSTTISEKPDLVSIFEVDDELIKTNCSKEETDAIENPDCDVSDVSFEDEIIKPTLNESSEETSTLPDGFASSTISTTISEKPDLVSIFEVDDDLIRTNCSKEETDAIENPDCDVSDVSLEDEIVKPTLNGSSEVTLTLPDESPSSTISTVLSEHSTETSSSNSNVLPPDETLSPDAGISDDTTSFINNSGVFIHTEFSSTTTSLPEIVTPPIENIVDETLPSSAGIPVLYPVENSSISPSDYSTTAFPPLNYSTTLSSSSTTEFSTFHFSSTSSLPIESTPSESYSEERSSTVEHSFDYTSTTTTSSPSNDSYVDNGLPEIYNSTSEEDFIGTNATSDDAGYLSNSNSVFENEITPVTTDGRLTESSSMKPSDYPTTTTTTTSRSIIDHISTVTNSPIDAVTSTSSDETTTHPIASITVSTQSTTTIETTTQAIPSSTSGEIGDAIYVTSGTTTSEIVPVVTETSTTPHSTPEIVPVVTETSATTHTTPEIVPAATQTSTTEIVPVVTETSTTAHTTTEIILPDTETTPNEDLEPVVSTSFYEISETDSSTTPITGAIEDSFPSLGGSGVDDGFPSPFGRPDVAMGDDEFPDVFGDSLVRDRLREIYERGDFSHDELRTAFNFDPEDYHYYYDYNYI